MSSCRVAASPRRARPRRDFLNENHSQRLIHARGTTRMIKVSVMYANKPGARFDHAYYRDKHMPLVKARMGDACNFYTVDKGWRAARRASRRPTSPCATSTATRWKRSRAASVHTRRRSWGIFRTTRTWRRSCRSARWSSGKVELADGAQCAKKPDEVGQLVVRVETARVRQHPQPG